MSVIKQKHDAVITRITSHISLQKGQKQNGTRLPNGSQKDLNFICSGLIFTLFTSIIGTFNVPELYLQFISENIDIKRFRIGLSQHLN